MWDVNIDNTMNHCMRIGQSNCFKVKNSKLTSAISELSQSGWNIGQICPNVIDNLELEYDSIIIVDPKSGLKSA